MNRSAAALALAVAALLPTVVAEPATDVPAEAQRAADRFVAAMRRLGVPVADAVRLVHRAYEG